MAMPEWYARLKRRTAEIIDFENDALERDMVRSQETPSEAQETEEDIARRLAVDGYMAFAPDALSAPAVTGLSS